MKYLPVMKLFKHESWAYPKKSSDQKDGLRLRSQKLSSRRAAISAILTLKSDEHLFWFRLYIDQWYLLWEESQIFAKNEKKQKKGTRLLQKWFDFKNFLHC